MQRGRGGYTIIEVMIVLAVGLITFLAAVSLFADKQGKTEFSQAMRDIQTRIQSVVNDVSVSKFPDASNFNCRTPGGTPLLTPTPSGSETGTNEDCIFLGKAVNIVTDTDPNTLKIYTVLGSRQSRNGEPPTTYNSDSETGVNPEPIMPPGPADLTETYNLPFSVTVLSANEDTQSSTQTYMLGFYNSLQSSAATEQGSQSIVTKGYLGIKNSSAGDIKDAIRGDFVPVANSKAWTICFQSSTSNEKAELVVNSSFSGVTTTFNYKDCS